MSFREADPLMIGNAFHHGVAHYYATKDIKASTQLTEDTFNKHLEGQVILPEEKALVDQNKRFSKVAVEKYAEHWKNEPIQILMPEVKFRVELPNSKHHCFFIHRILHPQGALPLNPTDTTREELLQCIDPRCQSSYFFIGRTDAVVVWRNMIWLLEHKTASQTGSLFFDKFLLDQQTTGYLYGIWKETGVRPHGFILNVIKKPRANSSDPFNISFEREPYIRDDQSLLEFEKEITLKAIDYERAFSENAIYKEARSCINFQRKCYYFDLCQRHQILEEGEFRSRPDDYVNEEYYSLLGMEKPTNA